MAISKWAAVCTVTGLPIVAISTRLLPFHRARHEQRASPTHWDSFVLSVITPSRHQGSQETYSLLIPASRFRDDLSDEEILARFTKGFFCGPAFTPERWLLSAIPFTITDISAIKKTLTIRSQNTVPGLVVGPEIWDPSSISPKLTPSVASLLFGNFLVLDSSMLTVAHQSQLPEDYVLHVKPPHAFVELAWGGTTLGLVGSHRFEASRCRIGHAAEAEEFIKVTLSTVSCVTKTGLAPSKYLMWFHVLYAKLLFSDGIRRVLAE
ncbi:hypothetical protein GGS24DRAFT_451076 [Hypoxylon argillaceum]|nr:hypothetical protein GGS24DRAFT_451076 [Hypoxylon argillaceum]